MQKRTRKKEAFLKLGTWVLVMAMLVSMLPMTASAIGETPDYVITGNTGGSFQVDGNGDYPTLAAALADCGDPEDDSTVIQFGAGGDPLVLDEVGSGGFAGNSLIDAVYTGKVEIHNSETPGAVGFYIPNAVRVVFQDLDVDQTGTAATEFRAVYLSGTGRLNIEDGTNITMTSEKARCVYNSEYGTVTMNGDSSLSSTSGNTIYNVGDGAVSLYGGTVSSASINGGAIHNESSRLYINGVATVTGAIYGIYNGLSAQTEITGGIVEATAISGSAIRNISGTVSVIGGTVRATGNSSSGDNYGIYNSDGTVSISGGTVSCADGRSFGSTAALFQIGTNASAEILGAANITGTVYGIINYGTKTSGDGAVHLSGGTIIATGIDDYGGVALSNQGTGRITIGGGTVSTGPTPAAVAVKNAGAGTVEITDGRVSCNGVGGTAAILNQNTGTVNISGGIVETTSTSANDCVSNLYGGTVNISGGAVSSAGTGDFAAAVSLGNTSSASTVSTLTLSGDASVVSAGNRTVRLYQLTTADKEAADIFGTTVYSDTLADIVIAGAEISGGREISGANYASAAVTAISIASGKAFLNWTSDSARTEPISGVNGASLESLTTGENEGVSAIYLKVGDPPASAPTALPTGGSFTDADTDEGQISGTISWAAASPATDITGYRIYWGSDATTKLAGHGTVLYTVSGAASAAQAIAADTELPAGASYFLIYSYNAAGNSTNCLAVAINDLIPAPAPALTVTVSQGTAAGSAKATILGSATSRFAVNITDTTVAIPYAGDPAPSSGANLVGDYTSGTDITTGVAAGKYIQVYDVDASGYVVKFYQRQLAAEDINRGAYTVTYNGNGAASGTVPADGTYGEGDTVTVLGNTGDLTKSGCTFAGWNTQADGDGTSYSAGATFSMGDANVVLYAVWTAADDEDADADIAAAKLLLPDSFTATEDSDANLLDYLNGLTGMSDTGVTLTLESSHDNVADNGTIAYTMNQATGNVVVHINKEDGTEDTKTIAVTIPAHVPTGNWADGAPAAEEGTDYTVEEDTYTICTAAGLAWLAEQVNGGNAFEGKTVELEGDLDLSAHYWTPIGTAHPDYYQFTGTFDGRGHELTGLYLGTEAAPGLVQGLFAIVGSAAEIKNLGIESARIYVGPEGFGGILAAWNYGKITKCYAKGEIAGADGVVYIGGLVASNEGGLIANCYCAADVAGGNYASFTPPAAGGLVGRNTGMSDAGYIVNCFATGDVSVGSGGAPWYTAYAGGLVGYNESQGRMENCFAAGDVTGGVFAAIGGVVGFLHNGFEDVPNAYRVYWNSDSVHILNGDTLDPGNKKGAGSLLIGTDSTTSETEDDIKASPFVATLNSNIADSVSVPDFTYFAWGPDEENVNNGYPMITDEPITDTYTVAYDANGATAGTVPTDSLGYGEGATVTVLGNTGNLTKTGFTFGGWNTQADGEGTDYAAGGTFMMGSQDVMLYAVWTAGNIGNNDGGSESSLQTPPANTVPVTVGGQTQELGATLSTTTQDGRTVATATLDTQRTSALLEAVPAGSTIDIPITANADVAVGELNGQLVKAMENKQAVLEIRTDTAAYTLPARQINIDAVSAQLGQEVSLSDIKVSVEIAKSPGETVRVVEDLASEGNFSIVVPPVDFSVTCTYGDRTVQISQFNAYVERAVAIPEGVDPSKITTAVVVDPDGTVRHVPTRVIVINGKYYAEINSLTNSTYSVIWHPVEFADVAGHWAKEAVNDMGSRMIVGGVGDGYFAPDQDITRAEFAAIVVRALGLKAEGGESGFDDVGTSDWYCGCIKTAFSYGLIMGHDNKTFGPNDKITREQAMAIIQRAMAVTGLKAAVDEKEIDELLAGYADTAGISGYARAGIAACLKAGIVSGRGKNLVAPRDNITRAEVAVMIQRLLEKSNLI